MKQPFNIVKVGGALVDDEARLNALLTKFAALPGLKALVHGGGRRATRTAETLGIESRMVQGRRVTSREMLEVAAMVYGGLVNKGIVARLQALGTNAIGLTGADMDTIRSHRRPPVDGTDYGFVGDIDRVDAARLKTLAEAGLTPILAPLTHDGNGNLLNTNADTIAAETAKALAQHFDVTLTYCFELPGVLACPDDKSSVIGRITRADYERLAAEGVVSGGMLPKIANALKAVEAGVGRVLITNAEALGTGAGTTVTL